MPKADLHVRTTASLGKITPTGAVDAAKKKRLAAIAIVDHECVDGVMGATEAGALRGVEVIPGVELTYETDKEAHIIGYFIDPHTPGLRLELAKNQMVRIQQVADTLEKLNDLGIKLVYENVMHEADGAASVSRMHIARHMARLRMVKEPKEALDKYLGRGKPAYVQRDQMPLATLLDFIREAGGVPALAHPKFGGAEELIPGLVKEGIKALEVYHPYHSKKDTERYRQIAKKYGLIEVGGTDSGPGHVGDVTVPYSTVNKLKKLIK
jgi:predicted metal-dependent phosphoesterase TrpH